RVDAGTLGRCVQVAPGSGPLLAPARAGWQGVCGRSWRAFPVEPHASRSRRMPPHAPRSCRMRPHAPRSCRIGPWRPPTANHGTRLVALTDCGTRLVTVTLRVFYQRVAQHLAIHTPARPSVHIRIFPNASCRNLRTVPVTAIRAHLRAVLASVEACDRVLLPIEALATPHRLGATQELAALERLPAHVRLPPVTVATSALATELAAHHRSPAIDSVPA
ncbi:MAG: hypothetical protein QG597_4737, partial [Actinomycetota bacterium]|nr:hypothetical protein [Actinomycetota bacterium]